LIPYLGGSGDSTLMKNATRQPTTRPVKRARRTDEENASTVPMSQKEITASATKAIATPFEPGTLTPR